MENRACFEAELIPQSPRSFIKLLKVNRELLVTQIRNTQCLLDNLIENEYFSTEDAEIAAASPTQPDKVRKILDLVQSKGEEVSEYFIYVLQQVSDAYIDLKPWLSEICFSPSELIESKVVVNTDPVSRYTQKLRCELGRDSKFIMSYAQKEEMLLEDTYTENVMELTNFSNENLGSVGSLASLLDSTTGVINEDGETVLVFGDAGVGKSILLQKMQHLWAKGELGGGAKFFFRFRCRMFSLFKESEVLCLKDLLFKHNCYPEQDPEEVFTFLLRFPHTALFTFDGFDELHSDFDLGAVPEASSPVEPTHPLVLLVNLLSGKLLKGAGKVLTTRAGTEVPRRLIRKKVLLRGFAPSHLQAYTRRFFPDRALQAQVQTQLEANPNLSSLCSVPLFCWIIFKCFEHFHAAYDSPRGLPDCSVTLTDVFLLVTEVHLNRALPASLLHRNTRSQVQTLRAGRAALQALGRVAYSGLERSLFVFGQEEVEVLEVPEEDLQLGFVRAVPEAGDRLSYEFFHVTLQSFFAALFLVVDDRVGAGELLRFFGEWRPGGLAGPACPRLSFLPFRCLAGGGPSGEDPFRNNDHFHFTNLFLCGLLSKAKQKLLRHLAPASALKKKRKALRAHLFSSMRAYLKSLPRCQTEMFSQVQAMPTFIWMLRCVYETQSDKMGQLAARGICANYIKLTYCNACSADCSAISFVMHHFRKRLALDLDNNNLNDYGVKELQPCFSRLTVLRLSVNQITDTGVKVLYEELTKYKIVTYLGLYNNQITDVGAKYLARLMDECSSLTHLKLGANKITSEGGKCLALAVQKSKSIFEIGMWGNKIGDEGAKAFAEALKNHPSLTNLSLAFNGISTEGGKSIAQALQHNTSVRIFWLTKNELDDEVAESFAEMLEVNQTLTHLWLIQNQITARGTTRLAGALQKNTGILEICLNGNLISTEEAKAFEDEKRIVCF
ncbi:nucleotide-binding oligomerization domain-containing protein 1 [Tachyglossus aculeatus]|uniref:nucleotide-binding oligomerization domain-containing protein 1 n=1 Tax=Tachyglossus aculeatus TaxID=9261 RepID=UPI0018F514A3|nr:nucleotide-binding oligomerization domain-containing protein 1 [Tachyglossus aculeatus]